MPGGICYDANLVPRPTRLPGAVLSTNHAVTSRPMCPRSGPLPSQFARRRDSVQMILQLGTLGMRLAQRETRG